MEDRAMIESTLNPVHEALIYGLERAKKGAVSLSFTFDPAYPGVVAPRSIGGDLTIITLEHQYRNIEISPDDSEFSVDLNFQGVPFRITVPTPAVCEFYDHQGGFRASLLN
jgi:hypothetical protein